jgi:cobalamin biosynthesis Co2+ chelatase CbiK
MIKTFESFQTKVELEWMYGDGDEYHKHVIDVNDYNSDIKTLKSIRDKCLNYDLSCINKLNDDEKKVFNEIYRKIPNKGGFKDYDYVILCGFHVL